MSQLPSTSKRVTLGDKNYETTLEQWFHEDDDASDVDDVEENFAVHSDHDTDSEQSISEEEDKLENTDLELEQDSNKGTEKNLESNDIEEQQNKNYYYGKNRYKWAANTPFKKNTRTPSHNIVLHLPGVRAAGQIEEKDNLEKIWNLLFDDDILKILVGWTNVKIKEVAKRYKNQFLSQLNEVDILEMKAFLGLLIFTAVFKSNRENISTLFATDGTGRSIFRSVMSKERFAILLVCLRFDDPTTRVTRRLSDESAAISEIFQRFFQNSQNIYTLGENTCIDEMLLPFRGRCKFKMYMPQKPAKYGIKIMILTDARTNYAYNAYIYSGKGSDGAGLPAEYKKMGVPTQAVLKLAKPLFGSHRNITADNWFSSIELIVELQKKGLTYTGTLRKNKKEIPFQFLPNKEKKEGSTMYGFTKDITLLSYVPKRNKCVLAVSSMHHSVSTVDNKPEIIDFYNSTKSGVDTLDQKCANYSSLRRTQRWPMAVFLRLLDMSTVNSFVVFNAYKGNVPIERSKFLKDLALSLVKPHMMRRKNNLRIPLKIRLDIAEIFNLRENFPQNDEETLEIRKYCYLCPSKSHRKTKFLCVCCHKPICLQCASKICKICSKKND